jgi:hypothetical protein
MMPQSLSEADKKSLKLVNEYLYLTYETLQCSGQSEDRVGDHAQMPARTSPMQSVATR